NFFAVTTERFCFLSAVSMYHFASPLIRIYLQATNAQLRGEQRLHPNLKHCAIDTKTEVEAKVPSVVNPS
ncbi:hypothetical protein ACSTEF_21470, partial [Vibrio vulnificus]|uniref:hypothetical protein n=1 Tax=Vibrio vulnificus TaxID=672 RepID=UPI003EDB4F24